MELHSEPLLTTHYTTHTPHEQSIPVAALQSMVPFPLWVKREEWVGQPQGKGPNKYTDWEVEKREAVGVQDRVCCQGTEAHCRPPPPSPFPSLDEEDPTCAHVHGHRKRERCTHTRL